MIRTAFVSGTLMVGLAAATPTLAEPQAFQGHPRGGDSAGDNMLRRHGMTVQQYDKMREEAESTPPAEK